VLRGVTETAPTTLSAEPDCTATFRARPEMPEGVKETASDCEPVKEPPPRSRPPPLTLAASAPVHAAEDEARLSERLVSEQVMPLTLKEVAVVVAMDTAPLHEL